MTTLLIILGVVGTAGNVGRWLFRRRPTTYRYLVEAIENGKPTNFKVGDRRYYQTGNSYSFVVNGMKVEHDNDGCIDVDGVGVKYNSPASRYYKAVQKAFPDRAVLNGRRIDREKRRAHRTKMREVKSQVKSKKQTIKESLK